MSKRNEKTIERYVSLYIRIQATDNSLSDVPTWSLADFERETGLTGKGQFQLTKSLARNVDIQQDVNNYFSERDISSSVIKPIKEQEYLEKDLRISKGVEFENFTKKSRYFESIKGKRVAIETNPTNFIKDAELLVKIAHDKAIHETQKYDGKQIKINIHADIYPDSKADVREFSDKSFQTLVRRNKADLKYDLSELESHIDSYFSKYKPKGVITITISILNYYE